MGTRIFLRKSTSSPYLLLANIGQLLTLRGEAAPRRGRDLQEIGLIKDAAVLCGGGKILAAGPQRELLRDPWLRTNRKKVKGTRLPGTGGVSGAD